MSSLFTARKIEATGTSPSFDDQHASAVPVDVYQHQNKLIILAPIAGVTIEDISVSITDDILTIGGHRDKPETTEGDDYFSQECFWGEFSRTIVLPVNVDSDKVAAFYKRGILRIEMPIIGEERTRVIPVTLGSE